MNQIEITILSIIIMIGLGYFLKRIDFLSEKDIDYLKSVISDIQNIIAFSSVVNIVPGEYLLYAGIADISTDKRVELDQRWPMKKIKVFANKNMSEGMVYAPVSFFVE